MYNNRNTTVVSDRYNTRGADEETLHYLTTKLDYPLEDVIRAVQEVGTEPDDVEEYIRDRYNRS